MDDERPPRVLVLDERDTVAVAVVALVPGERLDLGPGSVEVREPVPSGHKVALAPVEAGGRVLKYGEVIGIATAPIAAGAHVHVHNLVSARLPG